MQHPLLGFTGVAEAALGRPVDSVVPLMHRQRTWLVAAAVAAVAMIVILGAAGVYGPLRAAIAAVVAGVTVSAFSRQHLLVRTGTELWLLAGKAWHHPRVEIVGDVTDAEKSISSFRFNDFMEIAGTRYVLPRVFTKQANELITARPDDGASADAE